jgi:hypothetical protein
MSLQKSSREDAEVKFAAKQKKAQEANRAMSDYEANVRRVDENTARLRALRLAKEAAEAAEPKPAARRKTATAAKAPKTTKTTKTKKTS